jgi:hypothetical protein
MPPSPTTTARAVRLVSEQTLKLKVALAALKEHTASMVFPAMSARVARLRQAGMAKFIS